MSGAGGAPGRSFEPDRLDDQSCLAEGDPSGMLRVVASSAAQVRMAYRSAREAEVARVAADGRPRAIVVAGVGSSALAGEVLEAVCANGAPLPIVTARGYRLPGWVGAADLVCAVSHSGRTEETLALAAESVRRGCRMIGVGPVGTPLRDLVVRAGGPYVPVSGSPGPSRTALWELTVPLVVAAASLGLVEAGEDVFESVARRLEDIAHRCRPSSESFINPGKTLAVELAGSVPMIWGTSPLARVAAHRLARQLSENAKYPAVWGEIPDASHDQLAVLDGPLAGRDLFHDPFADEPGESGGAGARLRLFLLRDAEELPQVVKCRTASVRLAENRGVPVSEILAEGAHPLERLATLVGLGDYGSVYLAMGYGIDPTSVPAVMELQARVSP
ncbi:SIS domain-containing protein [Sphaerimonospora thailandensis]|uniref:Bifunctional glucose-6-phosphate/mannose-6-phosphate isomerase n=1 Tax=Sphaerimonospora thailandensis TaxID=795644 RepID=A0A8J3W2R9_9ACTN|nr:SIS domain-containing protein [Sphaerimonospora thailandensis]GIH73518.1 bifunctional glucose-6-phosphate/mannose-6-phosphate isomerase [Sphaerimonospora thailandensis]